MSIRVDVVHVKRGDPPPLEVSPERFAGHALAQHAAVLEAGTQEGNPAVMLSGQIRGGENDGKWVAIELTGRIFLGIAGSIVAWEPKAANNLAGFEAIFNVTQEGDQS